MGLSLRWWDAARLIGLFAGDDGKESHEANGGHVQNDINWYISGCLFSDGSAAMGAAPRFEVGGGQVTGVVIFWDWVLVLLAINDLSWIAMASLNYPTPIPQR